MRVTGYLAGRGGLVAVLAASALLAACAQRGEAVLPAFAERPDTAVAYEVVLEGSPSDAVSGLSEDALASYRLRKDGAASLAFLRRRAESDVPLLLKILRSFGYYSATAAVRVEPTVPGEARVILTVEPGPAYTLIGHRLLIVQDGPVPPPELDATAFDSPVGGEARAADIAAAEAAAVAELRRRGFPYARFEGREGLADPEAATLQVDSRIAAGPAFSFGEVRFEGVGTIERDYLLSYLPWQPGDSFDSALLREYQNRLFLTDLFLAARVGPPEQAPPAADMGAAPLPITVAVDERPARSVSGGLRYDTDIGPSLRAAFEHRNLFGANERLLAEADAGLVEQRAGLSLRKPQFLRPGQELVGRVTVARVDDHAFDAETLTGFAGLERKLSESWRAGLGGLAELSTIDDAGNKGTATLLGAPAFAAYDDTRDLLDPKRGFRLRVEATPFLGMFDGGDAEFLVLDARGSAYLPLDAEAGYVAAARGRVASILAPGLDVVPPTRRLYAGGGGSVRGYAQDFIGPLDADDDPIGGRSALEAGIELRARLSGDIGGVVFAEAGSVSTEMFPDFTEGVQTAAGVGLRYLSPAGPIRVDIAFPINGRKADDSYQIYFSIGQAF